MSIFLVLAVLYQFKTRSDDIRRNYITQRKEQIKSEVDYAVEQIDYERKELNSELCQRLQEQVDYAYEISMSLYRNYKNLLPQKDVETLIISALRNVRFFNGRGYYFIAGHDDILRLWPLHPENEGKSYKVARDTAGEIILKDLVDLSNKSGAGLYSCRIEKPGGGGESFPKLLCVRKFEPYQWLIGTGEYIDDFTSEVQERTIERLEKVCVKYSRSLFGATYEGVSILGPAKGQKVIGGSNAQAEQVVKTLIGKAKSGGGFVEYVMPEIDGQISLPKISYVKAVEGWDWYIGSGVYLDNIDAEIALLERELQWRFYLGLGIVAAIFIFIFGIAYFMARRFAASVSRVTEGFTLLVQDAVDSGEMIESLDFEFSEFGHFAQTANVMLLSRKRSEENLRATLNSIGEGVISTDITGRIVRMNRVACVLTGSAFKDFEGCKLQDVFKLIDPLASRAVELPFDKVLLPGAVVQSIDNVLLESREGRKYHVVCSLAPVRLEEGETVGTVLVFRDRTGEYRIQEKLRQGQKLESIGQLAGGIAHDFNNMLGGIIGGAELLEGYIGDNEKCARYLGMIMRSAERAADLAGKLLAFARRQVAVFSPVYINSILENTIEVLRSTIDKRIDIEFSAGKSSCRVVGDDAMLQSVFLNIGINASHAMPEGGKLTIKTETVYLDEMCSHQGDTILSPGDYIDIEFCDTGCGIAADILPHIFEPFFTTKDQGKGTGLGLAAAYGTVRQHNGAISVYSEPGRGACFHVILPVAAAEVSVVSNNGGIVSGTGTILLVDDEPVMRATGQALLEECGYRVILAENGRDAVEQYRLHCEKISLVILDMIMPLMNGRDCFHELKKIKPDLSIIISSGFTQSEELDKLIKGGATGFLQKPFRRVELSRAVDNALKGGRTDSV